MNPINLSSEVRKRLSIALVGTVLLVLGGYFLGIQPLAAARQKAEMATRELEEKIEAADRLAQASDKLVELRDSQVQRLSNDMAQHMAPRSQTLSWATTVLSPLVAQAGVDLIAISPVNLSPPPWQLVGPAVRTPVAFDAADGPPTPPAPPRRVLTMYAVEIQLHGGYNPLCEFLTLLRQNNPYATPTSLTIRPRTESVDVHQVRMVVTWPMVMTDQGEKMESLLANLRETMETIQPEPSP